MSFPFHFNSKNKIINNPYLKKRSSEPNNVNELRAALNVARTQDDEQTQSQTQLSESPPKLFGSPVITNHSTERNHYSFCEIGRDLSASSYYSPFSSGVGTKPRTCQDVVTTNQNVAPGVTTQQEEPTQIIVDLSTNTQDSTNSNSSICSTAVADKNTTAATKNSSSSSSSHVDNTTADIEIVTAATAASKKQKKAKLPLTDSYVTVAQQNRPIVSPGQFYDAIQEVVTTDEQLSLSDRKKYPKMWKVAERYTDVWVKNGWEGPYYLSSNVTNFKKRIVKELTRHREPSLTSNHQDIVQAMAQFRSANANELQQELRRLNEKGSILLYLQDSFLDYSIRTWRTDVTSKEKVLEKPDVSDMARLISILGMNDNRHLLLALVRGKVISRREIDGARPREEIIFEQIATQFNSKNVIVIPPKEFETLDSHGDIKPNNVTRIGISRNAAWLMELYKKLMSEYRISMHKWKSGTGGGSGAPKDYDNWNTRDQKLFSNYGGGKGTRVQKDYLGYMYMVDNESGGAFSASFQPAPKDTVLEDGDDSSGEEEERCGNPRNSKKLKTSSSSSGELTSTLLKTMNKMSKNVKNVLDTMMKDDSAGGSHDE